MKQLVLKELREHFKEALIGLAVFTVMLVLAFSTCSAAPQQSVLSMGYSDAEDFQPLLARSVLTQAAFFCAIFGTLLGWLQIRAEKHPDLWAFLVHRPISRATILRSKVLAGLLLYAAGAGLPLLGFVTVASIPGHIAAPFEWAMALPLLTIFLAGPVYYLAGLLTGLRKARWYGSRAFGLGLAVPASFATLAVAEFWQALLVIVMLGTLLALAVWGSFKTGGYYRGQPTLSKMALTMAGVASVVVVSGIAISFSMNLILSSASYTYSQYQLFRDGKIVKMTQDGMDEASLEDLSGKPLINETNGQPMKLKEAQQRFANGLSVQVYFEDQSRERRRWGQAYSSAGRFFHPWRVLNKKLWYVTSDGRLVAYHAMTRTFKGSLTPPVATNGPADPITLSTPNYWDRSFRPYELAEILVSKQTAYLVDLEKQEFKPLFTAPKGESIGGFSEQATQFYPASSNFVLLATEKSIRLMNFEGTTKLAQPYEPSFPNYSAVSVLFLTSTNPYAMRFDPDYLANQKLGGKLLPQYRFIDTRGTVSEIVELKKLPDPQRNDLAERFMLAMAPPAFPIYPLEETYRVPNMLRLVPALLCAVTGWWLARRHHLTLRARIGWSLFHFLLGIPGLLAFLAVQEWPALEPCPKCRQLRAINRDQCEHCSSDFAPPATTGIEIFEPLGKE